MWLLKDTNLRKRVLVATDSWNFRATGPGRTAPASSAGMFLSLGLLQTPLSSQRNGTEIIGSDVGIQQLDTER